MWALFGKHKYATSSFLLCIQPTALCVGPEVHHMVSIILEKENDDRLGPPGQIFFFFCTARIPFFFPHWVFADIEFKFSMLVNMSMQTFRMGWFIVWKQKKRKKKLYNIFITVGEMHGVTCLNSLTCFFVFVFYSDWIKFQRSYFGKELCICISFFITQSSTGDWSSQWRNM